MSNPIIAPQLAPANSPKTPAAHALPADAKVSGKNVKEIKAEAASAAEEFASSLKEGLDKETKKGESKDGHVVQGMGAQAKPILLLDPKTGKPAKVEKVENTDSSKKDFSKQTNVMVNPLAGVQVATPVQALATAQKAAEANAQTEDHLKSAKTAKVQDGANSASFQASAVQGLHSSSAQAANVPTQTAGVQTKASAKGEVSGKDLKLDTNPKSASLNPLQEMLLTQQPLQANTAAQGAQMQAAHAQALKTTEGSDPQFSHAFEIESLGVAATPNKENLFSDKVGGDEKRTPSSKVSTSDFLSLRDLTKQNTVNPMGQSQGGGHMDLGTAIKAKDGKKDKLEALGGKEAFAGMMSSHISNEPNIKTMDATVTTGSAGKTVMTHDAIHEMSKQVNLLSQAREDGEIKIRLRPDHLGELHMSVKAQGQQVSIEIKAQNAESKKIIEESLASLKDSLAGQNLTLASVNVVSAPTHSQAAADQGAQLDMSQFRQNSGQQNSGREFQQGGRQDQFYEDMAAPVNLSSVRRQNASVRGGQGLDLIA